MDTQDLIISKGKFMILMALLGYEYQGDTWAKDDWTESDAYLFRMFQTQELEFALPHPIPLWALSFEFKINCFINEALWETIKRNCDDVGQQSPMYNPELMGQMIQFLTDLKDKE